MITIDNVSKSYEGKIILKSLSISFEMNHLYLLRGGNGSGKTTFLRILADLIKPSTGSISFNGIRNCDSELFQNFGAFFGNNTLIPFLRAEEYFELVNSLRGNSTDLKTLYTDLKLFFNNEVLNQSKPLAKFSAGNKSKVGIAATFIGSPQFLILDEPFAHLDSTANLELERLLQARYWNKEGGGVISSHSFDFENRVFDSKLLLEDGYLKSTPS